MARALHGLLSDGGMVTGPLGTVMALLLVTVAVFVVTSLVSFLCASHHQHWKSKAEKKGRLPPTTSPSISPPRATAEAKATTKEDRKLVSSLSGIGSRALEVAKMVSWKKREEGEGESEEEEEEEEDVVWKKTILMGNRCRPLNFSGSIIYDSQGKQVHGFPIEDDSRQAHSS